MKNNKIKYLTICLVTIISIAFLSSLTSCIPTTPVIEPTTEPITEPAIQPPSKPITDETSFIQEIPKISLPFTPAREARGVWMSRFDYIKTIKTQNPDSIKQYIKDTFSKAKNANLNMIFFQVRGNGDAFYKSNYEPWSNMLTGTLGKDPGWDPLDFAIETAHELGLELHAWINTFPAWRGIEDPINTIPIQPILIHPEWVVCDSAGNPMPRTENHYISFSPGIPAVHDHIVNVVDDIISKYNVDGIHFDYIRYPEGSPKLGYSHDSISVKRFNSKQGNPLNLDWEDWQRDQVTAFIAKAYDSITSIKPWVKVSAAVIGNYNNSRWNGYHIVYQDARRWSELGKIDMIIPMIYYGRSGKINKFPVTIRRWKEKFSVERPVLPGLGAYKIPWEEILEEIDDVRMIGMQGCVFFAASSFDDEKWLSIKSAKFQYPALIPALPWKDSTPPLSPENFNAEKNETGIKLTWKPPTFQNDSDTIQHFVIYRSKSLPIDLNNGENIFAIVSGDQFEYTEESEEIDRDWYYTITALDNAENESEPVQEIKVE